MIEDFSKVSLGFAEFVSKLIHETFDAILESQNYQLDKFYELNNAISLSNTQFKNKFISDDEFNEFQLDFFGFVLSKNSKLNQTNIDLINSILDNDMIQKSIKNDQLTEFGYENLTKICLNKLVDLKKSKINMIINHPELARLIIESGEIKTKLELFCLNQSFEEESPKNLPIKKVNQELEKKASNISKTEFSVKRLNIEKSNGIKVNEVIDNQTQQKTLLIDRKSLVDLNVNTNVIPTTRLVANPLSNSTNSNLFSEVTIKFKSI